MRMADDRLVSHYLKVTRGNGLSLLLVLSFAPRGFFLGTPDFPSPQKPTFPNSKSTRNQVDEEPLCGCATSKSSFIYYLFMSGYTKNIATSSLPQVPLLLKDRWYFLLSRTAYWGKLFVWFVPVHFLHASITVSYHLSGQKLLCRKARNTFDPFKEKEYISK